MPKLTSYITLISKNGHESLIMGHRYQWSISNTAYDMTFISFRGFYLVTKFHTSLYYIVYKDYIKNKFHGNHAKYSL